MSPEGFSFLLHPSSFLLPPSSFLLPQQGVNSASPNAATRRLRHALMKILVPIKRVVDPYAKVRPLPDGSGMDTTGLKFEINPFDEIAMEEAVRLKEKD